MTISILYGARNSRGRLDKATQALIDYIARNDVATDRVDLDPIGLPAEERANAMERQNRADAVIAVSPVYKGTYSGYLKTFLDFLPREALAGKPVGIVAMGEVPDYALGVAHGLRDVYGLFLAVVADTSVYLTASHFETKVVVAKDVRDLIETFAADFTDFCMRHAR
jgi:NAD(P)H-dependent FMN reductase